MASTDVPMKEFLLWSNCPNNCQFCWQRKMDKAETNLTEEQKLQSIYGVMNEISSLPYSDILIVGGEVYCAHSQAVNDALIGLFELIKERIDNGLTRFMYANSNLLYDDLSVVTGLLDTFAGSEDKLRFTTSYDIYGRYSDEAHRQLFLNNLAYITQHYPNVHPVVNCILTSQMCNHITGGHFNIGSFAETYGLAFVNMIPYIPVEQGDIMTPTWSQVTGALTYIETIAPHYLHNYVYQLDFHQDRVLKEYHKSEGFVVCTSEYLACGHNSNYTRATDDGSCYVCKMKRTIAIESTDASEDELSDLIQEGRKIVTIGDYCSYYVWNHYRQPDLVVYDGVTSSENDIDVEMLVRQSQTKRTLVVNDGPYLGDELRDAVKSVLGTLDERSAIRVEGEEDSAVFECLNSAPIGTVVIYGDSNKRCMSYYVVTASNHTLYDKSITIDEIKGYEGTNLITCGDVVSWEVWNNFRQPDVMVIDGKNDNSMETDVFKRIKNENIEYITIKDTQKDLLLETIHNHSKPLIVLIDGEDDNVKGFIKDIPNSFMIYGSPLAKCMMCSDNRGGVSD